jgi:hypothetical protein
MSRARVRGMYLTLLLLGGAMGAGGCGSEGGGFLGQWESNFGGVVKLDLQPGGKVVISTMGQQFEGTWETTGKNQIVVHGPRDNMTLSMTPEGELSDGMLGSFKRLKN